MTQSIIYTVEDDDDDRGFLLDAFEVNGCTKELVFFYSYEELLQVLDSLPDHNLPQLIILDNHIQSKSAVATIDLLLNNTRFRQVKLAIYTTSLPTKTCADYMAQGVHLCLEKGTTVEEIRVDISKFCQLAASSMESAAD